MDLAAASQSATHHIAKAEHFFKASLYFADQHFKTACQGCIYSLSCLLEACLSCIASSWPSALLSDYESTV